MTMMEDMVRPLALTGSLLVRFWPQLLLIGAIGCIAHDLLLDAAVGVGMQYPLGGMVVLSLVVLTKLLVVVLMFVAFRPGLPALAALRQGTTEAAQKTPPPNADTMLGVTAAVILPFFAYYAAWGFLGDTVREYSRLALERVPFGERLHIFDLLQSRGLIAAIVACWVVRWFAKRMSARSRVPWWRVLIVAADASWIFIGLYALGVWKDDFIAWLGAGSLLETFDVSALSLSMAAHASEGFVPVEFRPQDGFEQARNLFFYALLPMVWLVMAAIINGYDLSAPSARPKAAPASASKWQKWLHDFAMYFFGGYRKRYRPVWACLKLTLGTGIATLLTCIVVYRALNWSAAWLWYGATRLLGPHDVDTWQLIGSVSSIFIGNPSDLDGGILFDAVRIALLAAVLEYAVSTQTRRGRRQQAAAI